VANAGANTWPKIIGRRSQKLKSQERVEQYLNPGTSLIQLDREAMAMSDTACIRRMNAAKSRLLRQCMSSLRCRRGSDNRAVGGGNAGPPPTLPQPLATMTPVQVLMLKFRMAPAEFCAAASAAFLQS